MHSTPASLALAPLLARHRPLDFSPPHTGKSNSGAWKELLRMAVGTVHSARTNMLLAEILRDDAGERSAGPTRAGMSGCFIPDGELSEDGHSVYEWRTLGTVIRTVPNYASLIAKLNEPKSPPDSRNACERHPAYHHQSASLKT